MEATILLSSFVVATEARGDVALGPKYDVQNCHGGQNTLSQDHLSMHASGNVDEAKTLCATRVNENVSG